jgi:hypothetical protein
MKLFQKGACDNNPFTLFWAKKLNGKIKAGKHFSLTSKIVPP